MPDEPYALDGTRLVALNSVAEAFQYEWLRVVRAANLSALSNNGMPSITHWHDRGTIMALVDRVGYSLGLNYDERNDLLDWALSIPAGLDDPFAHRRPPRAQVMECF